MVNCNDGWVHSTYIQSHITKLADFSDFSFCDSWDTCYRVQERHRIAALLHKCIGVYSYTLQCGMWLWNRDSEFTKCHWIRPAYWNLVSISTHHLLIHFFTSSSTSPLFSVIIPTLVIHHSFSLSLQAQNLPFQQILPTVDFFLPTGLPHDNGTGPDLLCSSFYF